MSLRDAAQQALEALEEYQAKGAPFWACDAAVAALRAALAEPQPEPVAWVSKHALDRIKDFDGTIYANGGFDDAAPLYAHPPQRQPLTIDECECAYHDLPNRPDWPNMATLWELLTAFVEGVRYAEKAHGIGGDK